MSTVGGETKDGKIFLLFCLALRVDDIIDIIDLVMKETKGMTTVLDIAAYILKKIDSLTAMKLQKLVYYSQAWSLVWDEKALYPEKIEAWANGPVAPNLYQAHRGLFEISRKIFKRGSPSKLTSQQRETVDAVIKFYGKHTSQWLSDLTHRENPWKDAREGLNPGQRGQREITTAAMAEYYGGL